jgi:hypothetical protein
MLFLLHLFYIFRNQVEICLGLCMMSDWPNALRLLVFCKLCCVCVVSMLSCDVMCVTFMLKWCVGDRPVMSG